MEVCCFKGGVWMGVVGGWWFPGDRGGVWGGGLYGVCSVCLTGSLSCQHWCGITCSPVSERQ